jgi:hypothetical protein
MSLPYSQTILTSCSSAHLFFLYYTVVSHNNSVFYCRCHLNDVTAFDVQSAVLNGHSIHLALLSRRSRFRAGTRYFKRGVDHEGQVANYNETEQIVTVDSPSGADASAQISYVQIRGSIPVFWAEINNLRYMPDLQIMDLPDTVPFIAGRVTPNY